MNLEQFAKASDLTSQSEIDRVCFLAYFYFRTQAVATFTAAVGAQWLTGMRFAAPNQTRLDGRLRESEKTVKAGGGFTLSVKFVEEMDRRFPDLAEKSQEVIDLGTILPPVDYQNTRGYIESLAKQINAAYEQNIFDGCAVLMRRLIEILLILSYRHISMEGTIKDANGNYFLLEKIVADAKNNPTLDLSRNSKGSLDIFRELGNFSAHKIEYTCRREYIKEHIQAYRALFGELLHKAGIRI
jgi:hypothetical protein